MNYRPLKSSLDAKSNFVAKVGVKQRSRVLRFSLGVQNEKRSYSA